MPAFEKAGPMPATGPAYTSSPCDRKSTRSNLWKISLEGWWIVHTTTLPSRAIPLSWSTSSAAEKESRPDVGSSRKQTSGPVTSSTPMAVRFFSPPERPLTKALPT
mmetsp:Transcript_2718/g.8935  ORF Transcript_2718/g.8935 Transcript_2718/m.8935 type:complete len:106 (+) Transcript_2718:166-483(+)